MYRYVIKRILMMIPVMLGVTFVIFSMMYISEGDPARMILGEGAQEAEVEALREELGLNDPFLTRYVNYIKGIVTEGDLGVSYTTGRSVSEEIFDRWPTTMLLAVLSVLLATAIGVPTGIISATKQYSIFDNLAMVLALVGVSMPNFWQGLVLILVFSVYLGILPPSGFYGPMYWILPAVTIGTSTAATIHPYDPLFYAGCHSPGLYPYSQSQRPLRTGDHYPPRPEECADSHYYRRRPCSLAVAWAEQF